MKWSILGLLLLGAGAALSASLLVASLRMTPPAVGKTAEPTEVQIVVAARSLPSMSIVDARSVAVKTVPAKDVATGVMRLPTDVIGKLVTVPIVEGQVFTTNLFADEKSGARLASALAHGMRAVSVSLKPDKAGLLYPGCIVDVLVSLNRPSTEGSGVKEAMSMTLLQGVEVLAIDDSSVMSDMALDQPAPPETSNNNPVRKASRDRLVTLMVNSNQAKALQLASQYGAVSLALRNPLDSSPVETDSTMLSDLADEYTRIVAALTPPVDPRAGDAALPPSAPGLPAPPLAPPTAAPTPEVGPDSAANAKAERGPRPPEQVTAAGVLPMLPPEDPKWEMLVNRSGQIELVRFRRLGEPWLQAGEDTFQWIWEGRALSKTNSAATK